jgi:Holliday junction resolvase RusA-like endonuclease
VCTAKDPADPAAGLRRSYDGVLGSEAQTSLPYRQVGAPIQHNALPTQRFRFAHILKEDAPRFVAKKADLDNLIKFVLDSLNAVAYVDDSQVDLQPHCCKDDHSVRQIVAVHAYKIYANDQPRTEVSLRVVNVEESVLSLMRSPCVPVKPAITEVSSIEDTITGEVSVRRVDEAHYVDVPEDALQQELLTSNFSKSSEHWSE